jgi:hypothetical protein
VVASAQSSWTGPGVPPIAHAFPVAGGDALIRRPRWAGWLRHTRRSLSITDLVTKRRTCDQIAMNPLVIGRQLVTERDC